MEMESGLTPHEQRRQEEEERQQRIAERIARKKEEWFLAHPEKTCIACGKTLSSRDFEIRTYSFPTTEDAQIQVALYERCTPCLETYRSRFGVPCVVCGQKFRSKLTYYAGYTLFGGGTGIPLHCTACADAFLALPENKQRFYLQSRINLVFPSPQVIYAEKDPLNHEIRYIGRTGNATDRHSAHTRDKQSERVTYQTWDGKKQEIYTKANWIYDLSRQGLKPVQEILYTVEPSAYVIEYEKRYILHALQHGWSILNYEVNSIGPTSEQFLDRARSSSLDFLHAPFEQLVSEQFFLPQGLEAFLRAWYDKPVTHEPEIPAPLPAPSISLSTWLDASYPTIDMEA